MDNVVRQLWDAIAGLTARLGKELQGRHMSATAPTSNDLIGWNATTKKWEPKSSVPAARAYNSANISVNDSTNTTLTYDSERYDTDTIHSTSSNTGRLTATTAGKYRITSQVRWANAADTTRRYVNITLNGTTIIAADSRSAINGSPIYQGVSTEYDLGAGDFVNTIVLQASGGAINVEVGSAYSPEFMMERTGPTGSAVGASGDSHGDLSDLTGPDDHTQYLLNDGTRAGSTGVAQDFGSNGIKADVIAESTGAAGVTADGVKSKDGSVVIANAGYIGSVSDTDAMQIEADGDVVFSQDVAVVGTLGVVGIISAADTTRTDTINEYSGGAGVTIEGVAFEDNVLTFKAGTTVNIIGFPDNLADALSFEEGGTAYMTFVTTDAGEKVVFGKPIDVTGNIVVSGTVDGVDIAAWIDQDVSSGSAPTFAQAITDNHVVTIDGTANDTEHAVFNAAGLEGLTDAELLAALSGDADAAFSWNGEALTSVGAIGCGAITSTAGVIAGANVESDTDDTDDLGTTSKRWGNLHLGHDVKLDSTPDADHETSGITAPFTANENQAFGDVCYIDGDGEMHLADADAIATSKVVGMCADATIAATASGDYLLFGIANHADGWAWTVGGYVFLTITGTSTNTLSQTAPTGADDCVVIIGVATHADRILFNPQTVIVEHTG